MLTIACCARCAIPKDMVSYNRSQGQHWSHKSKSTQQKKDWVMWLRSNEGLGIPVMQTTRKKKVTITRIISEKMRKFEKVNLYAAAKPVEDALVDLGWLIDDSEKYCELEVTQVMLAEAPEWMRQAYDIVKAKIAIEVADTDAQIS